MLPTSPVFEKNDIGWPQQPLTEKVLDISEKLDFWWSFPQKGAGIGQLGSRDDQTIRFSNFFWWNEAVEVIEAIEAVAVTDVTEVIEAAEVLRLINHCWGLESNQVIRIQLYFYVSQKSFSRQNHEISCWVLTIFLLEAVEASRCHFFKNWCGWQNLAFLRDT